MFGKKVKLSRNQLILELHKMGNGKEFDLNLQKWLESKGLLDQFTFITDFLEGKSLLDVYSENLEDIADFLINTFPLLEVEK